MTGRERWPVAPRKVLCASGKWTSALGLPGSVAGKPEGKVGRVRGGAAAVAFIKLRTSRKSADTGIRGEHTESARVSDPERTDRPP